MPELPLVINGVTRMVWVQSLTEDTWRAEEHQYRREGVLLRRKYYQGTQYEHENLKTKEDTFGTMTGTEALWKRLPEHMRKHAYSTQIAEGLNFLSDQIAGNMIIDSDSDEVEEFFDKVLEQSNLMYRWQEITGEVLLAGDVFARLVPQPLAADDEPAVRIEFWPAEDIEVDYDDDDWQKMVEVRYERYVQEKIGEESTEVRYVHVFNLQSFGELDSELRTEAVETIYREEMDDPWLVRRLGLPFIPWVHISGEKVDMRSMFGRSMITEQLMESADRYNAVCQLEYVVLRYNSYANLVVVGDAAHLQVEQAEIVRKDVADVISFPGGTNAFAVSLPTDTDIIKEQKQTLVDALFRGMGLERLDPSTISSFGGVSGYALEILNRKTDGTFKRIVENMRQGVHTILDLALDTDAYVRNAPVVIEEETFAIVREWWQVDPDAEWPDREFRIDFGTAYIVDEVAVRDQFVAGLISRQEALRKLGYDDDQIDEIVIDIEASQPSLETALTQGANFDTERS